MDEGAEGLSLGLLEGMAAGACPVVTSISGNRDVICHEDNGLLVPPGKPEEMAAAIVRLVRDDALQQRLRGRALEFVGDLRVACRSAALPRPLCGGVPAVITNDLSASDHRKAGRILWLTPDRFDIKADKSSWVEMARCLDRAGWDVTVLASHSAGADSTCRGRNSLSTWSAVDLPLVFRVSVLVSMYRWLRVHWRPGDFVIVNPDALWLAPLLKRLGIEFVHLDVRTLPVNVHGFKGRLDWLLFWYLPMALFKHRVDGYSFITQALQREVERQFAFSPLPQRHLAVRC
jgi:hypothetical protein